MFPALLTTFLFSFSVLFASRSSKVVGSMQANVSRLFLAMILLGIWAHVWGGGMGGAGLPWFLLSGFIGFGLGDIALFGALPRIGPRLAILLTQCLAAPIAGVSEYLLLGTQPTLIEIGFCAVILTGVALALAPDTHWEGDAKTFRIGVLFGIGSAMGQALGAVFSRRGNAAAALAGSLVDGGTAAYQRITAGVLTTLVFWGVLTLLGKSKENRHPAGVWKKAAPLVIGNALSGPTFGVACFQWALLTTPSVKVLPIVATSPLVTMALAWIMEGTRPANRAILGGLLAVSGAAGLAWIQAHGR
jgi:drug/metabolite transporter (DMT)-like permease